MDAVELWRQFTKSFEQGWPVAAELTIELLAHPAVRALGLILIVYLTIRVIAGIYSGDKQNAELGPVAIRPHSSNRFTRDTVRLPHELMPMSMDGVSARCRILYVYTDAKGRRRKRVVATVSTAKISVSPVKLSRVQSVIYGQEIPDAPTRHVCFPPVDTQEPSATVPSTPERAADYARIHGIIQNWTEDDTAAWISAHPDLKDEVESGKVDFITRHVAKAIKVETGWRNRLARRHLFINRPNVVGSYYLKFEFSHEPLFVLTRHPDRDLKMTAWLTILTSMFALIMDWWPNGAPPFGIVATAEAAQSIERAPPRTVRLP